MRSQRTQQTERQQGTKADRPERKAPFPGQMDDDTRGGKQNSGFAQSYGRLREGPHGLEQGLQDGDHGRIEQHRIMPGQDGAPGPETVLSHQMLDEAAPEEFVPIDEPGLGIMPCEQEQQARKQQGRRRRTEIMTPGGPCGEQGRADRQQGEERQDSHGKADFMVHAPHGREDLQQGRHTNGQKGRAPGRSQTPGQKDAQAGQ